jgi:ABC-type multidrug transport system fused ATPase/permease subunit
MPPASVYSPLGQEDASEGVGPNKGGLSEQEKAGWFSKLFFGWISPLLAKGFSKKLEMEDVPVNSTGMRAESMMARWTTLWDAAADQKKPAMRMVAVMWPFVRRTWLLQILMKIVGDLLRFVQPLCMQAIIQWLTDMNAEPPFWASFVAADYRGAYYVFVMIGAMLLQGLVYTHCFFLGGEMAFAARSTTILAIYEKALGQAIHARADTTTGKVVNLMSSDCTRLQWYMPWTHLIFTGTLQFAIACWYLWQLIGSALLGGLVVIACATPAQTWCVEVMRTWNARVLDKRDKRLGKVSELLGAVKLVKCNGWEKPFEQRINTDRETELAALFKYFFMMLMSSVCWEAVPTLVAIAVFSWYALASSAQFTTEVAFTSLALLDIVAEPCTIAGWIISDCLALYVAFGRIGAFLCSDDIDSKAVQQSDTVNPSRPSVVITTGHFAWGFPAKTDPEGKEVKKVLARLEKALEASEISEKTSKEATAALLNESREADMEKAFQLREIDLEIDQGILLAIVGEVGSGKSSLLQAILGEMKNNGEHPVEVNGAVTYAAQTAYIFNATVKENITFGRRFDSDTYNKVLDACCLRPDLSILAKGDRTEIGVRLITIRHASCPSVFDFYRHIGLTHAHDCTRRSKESTCQEGKSSA